MVMQVKSQTSDEGSKILLFLIILTFSLAFLFVKDGTFFGDEGFHFTQIDKFLRGDYSMDGSITTLPGYHGVQALVAWIMGEHTLGFYRLVNLLLSIASVILLFGITRSVDPTTARAKTVQYAFLPILFPFFFLLYTDVLSLFLGVAACSAYNRRAFAWALLIAGLSILIRQNNIVWFLFFAISFALESGFLRSVGSTCSRRCTFSFPAFADAEGRGKSDSSAHSSLSRLHIILSLGICAVVFALFGVFVVRNGGIAIGDAGAHPFPQMHLGNIYFLLFLAGILFLPLHLSHLHRIGRFLLKHPLAAPISIGFFVFGMLTFANTHNYNQDIHSVFLRNRVLEYFTLTPLLMTAFFIPTTLAFLSLLVTKLEKPYQYLLYPFGVLYLLPSWLIEQRYYLIPFVFFLLFRKSEHGAIEWLQAFYSILFSAILFWIVASRWLFL